jgi:Tfp pilus assembly protein FimT
MLSWELMTVVWWRFSRAALTLCEIIVVVAIITFLAATALPGFLFAAKRAHAGGLNRVRLLSSARRSSI